METSSQKVWATYVILKNIQSNQSHKGQKFTQYGHTADNSIPDCSFKKT
jgi:hypothetical protein